MDSNQRAPGQTAICCILYLRTRRPYGGYMVANMRVCLANTSVHTGFA